MNNCAEVNRITIWLMLEYALLCASSCKEVLSSKSALQVSPAVQEELWRWKKHICFLQWKCVNLHDAWAMVRITTFGDTVIVMCHKMCHKKKKSVYVFLKQDESKFLGINFLNNWSSLVLRKSAHWKLQEQNNFVSLTCMYATCMWTFYYFCLFVCLFHFISAHISTTVGRRGTSEKKDPCFQEP